MQRRVSMLACGLFILAALSASANGPGNGRITVHPGGGVASLEVRYELSQLMGDPVVGGVYRWEGSATSLDPAGCVWLEVENSMGKAFIQINPTVPPKGRWGMDVPGSPDWDKLLARGFSGTQAVGFADARTAKQFWIQGFRVINAELSSSY